MLSVIWTVFLCMALLCGAVTGRLAEVTAAVPTGASEAITLAISITGLMCFWSGVMELLQASGLAERLSRLMAPVLRPLFGSASQDKQAMEAVSANVTANLLGLSNAATPLGLRASERLYVLAGATRSAGYRVDADRANATSIQLIPSTWRRFVRFAELHAPFDIMLPVWGSLRLPLRRCCSAASCCVLFRDGEYGTGKCALQVILSHEKQEICRISKQFSKNFQTRENTTARRLLADFAERSFRHFWRESACMRCAKAWTYFQLFCAAAVGLKTAVQILLVMVGMLTVVCCAPQVPLILRQAYSRPHCVYWGIPKECTAPDPAEADQRRRRTGDGAVKLYDAADWTAMPDAWPQ